MAALPYRFEIPNTKTLMYQIFAYGLLLLNVVALSAVTGHKTGYLLGMLLLLAIAVSYDYYKFKRTGNFQPNGLLLLMVGLRWLQLGIYWAFFLNLALWALYHIARRRFIITVSEQGVTYPGFPAKEYRWEEIQQLILKDNILTLITQTNTVYQPLVYNVAGVGEKEFNDFCRKQLLL